MKNSLPDWLRLWFQSALISEVYINIRVIAIGFTSDCELTVRYYLDREPKEFDYDSIQMVVSEVLANTSNEAQIKNVIEECKYSVEPMSEIDRLGGLVCARREYDMDENNHD